MKKVEIKTKRMVLRPMSDDEIGARIEAVDSDELRAAYGEMLAGCKGDPENRVWYAPWQMVLKDSGVSIGEIGFKGPGQEHAVEIGCGVLPEHRRQGYAAEALEAMTRWAFGKKDIVFVEAEADPDNKASLGVLEKCGFVPDGTGAEGPRFVLECPLTNWSSVYMLFGISIGMAIGQLHDQMLWGMAIGMSLGVLVGMLLNNSAKKSREALRQQRKTGK
mgnify:CR=1 FL=1